MPLPFTVVLIKCGHPLIIPRRTPLAGGAAGDDTVSDVATDVHTAIVAGGITRDISPVTVPLTSTPGPLPEATARDGAAAAAGQVCRRY
ncbi:hypothetical protein O5169_27840 [Escherichia coli]|nr:hypothetical protein [Escherichia coli]